MRFSKMHGIGNDYIYVNCLEEAVSEPEILSRKISDRHFGIGADGLILIRPSLKADFAMEMYNADGSVGEMCGNGIRCLGKYVYERGLTVKKELDIETKAGLRHLHLIENPEQKGEISMVEVDMGNPILEADQVPVICDRILAIDEPITVNGVEYRMTGVSMGNPHAVIFTKRVRGLDLEWLGPAFEYHGRFPKRVNVEFVEVVNSRILKARVWERGSGETLACGTGACAIAVAGVLNHFTERKVTVQLSGGDLFVDWQKETDKVLLTGPANHVFDGEYRMF